ncbi:hypothetical protein Glove_326g43 [Diversispora epigaea]|uniref:Serine-threonine/tyrosine-protein kinase catalytic domain-containing protein n=1 Tax=Diversispora epigaea TaxID=1348612 RepID=A0A397HSR7_9GLOM|nr:hypothetical protein Glove_326g43 [Diversispora epigaea]
MSPGDISVLNLIIEIEKSIIDADTQKQRTESRMLNELIKWIPYSQFKDIKYIAEGGFGVVNSAIWIKDKENEIKVALKNLHNSKDMTDDFLKEVISHGITSSNDFIIKCYGITRDPNTNNNIMNHNNKLIHGDLHSGNILMGVNGIFGSIRIADTSTNYVYGVIPEIFKDSSYSQASDICSFGMLMWNLHQKNEKEINSSYHPEAINTSRPLSPMIALLKLMLIGSKEPVSEVKDYKSVKENFEIDFDI